MKGNLSPIEMLIKYQDMISSLRKDLSPNAMKGNIFNTGADEAIFFEIDKLEKRIEQLEKFATNMYNHKIDSIRKANANDL